MKNPVEKILKESSVVSELYHKLSKLRGKLDKEMNAIGKKFSNEITKIEKKAKKKLKAVEHAQLWEKGGFEKLAVKVHKKTEALMKTAQKDCKLVIAKLRK
ncbi:MAG TPA: hypothetical protein DDW94_07995 [Deltaproteobacteria bacterium]|nr:MAG: hypothetical protein A2Z79_02520 [Deltaproteobacteria bacterium GWA2_55_82]OGQ62686.1 MAG: hypothetical protein A3I81_09340 [Deltaproteobacteria bacterium RIFCSPLOWO2_02_FULL_55_12]OIJ74278.1 MAG: hypothetical protein A2V21_308420 [Deltaproteobacteria bacterium GWC2_55_46]HBG46915.1 hypothetical protein [Deltaproteobacteria bacterium]HCY11027.1 hypothetical protein [Deltaproteobacteria bacterium]